MISWTNLEKKVPFVPVCFLAKEFWYLHSMNQVYAGLWFSLFVVSALNCKQTYRLLVREGHLLIWKLLFILQLLKFTSWSVAGQDTESQMAPMYHKSVFGGLRVEKH